MHCAMAVQEAVFGAAILDYAIVPRYRPLRIVTLPGI
jgi:hypothetical protein